ncbi:Mur ligase family protein [Peribacillus kribbensis]|uniref:Mur ligase family protein n=1 Tax=Peribacillus kribbensis TaxID=356658 RepID=UPI0003FC07B8|nr:UDP-N-acetylmuramoyl-tripeptide--D-alanyl-D-alanine ligase [Peribacillus kribbensis]
MISYSVKDICEILDGEVVQGSRDFIIKDAVLFTVKMGPDKLLFLRQRWKIDWTRIQKSTPCVIVTDTIYNQFSKMKNCTVIKVKDVEKAFWRFTSFYRSQFNIPVVAVTGTSGKTTTKEMIKHILSFDHKVAATISTANSRTHHFTYLLSIDKSTDAAVFETAVGKPGDVLLASRYFKPTIGIITNIGITHLDGCKTPEAYFQAKAEMVEAVGQTGTLILNMDDENIKKIQLAGFHGRVITVGIDSPADYMANSIEYSHQGMKFMLNFQGMEYPFFVPGYGRHQVLNLLAAIAAVHQMGVDLKTAAQRMLTFKNLPSHLEYSKGMGGAIILDDTWNSNPTSLKTAFETLTGVSKGKKRIALIGDIKALGNLSLELHHQTGEMIANTGVDILITVGPMAAELGKQAEASGMRGNVYSFPNIKGVLPLLKQHLDSDSILLIKCSGTDKPIIQLKKLIIKQT